MKTSLQAVHFVGKLLCLVLMLALSLPIEASAQIPIDPPPPPIELPPNCRVGTLPAEPEDQIILICA